MQSVLNVRMDSALKERGDRVLSENGVSVSAAVRALWSQLANTRELPDFIKNTDGREEAKQVKREALEKLTLIGGESAAKSLDQAAGQVFSTDVMYDEMWSKYEALS